MAEFFFDLNQGLVAERRVGSAMNISVFEADADVLAGLFGNDRGLCGQDIHCGHASVLLSSALTAPTEHLVNAH